MSCFFGGRDSMPRLLSDMEDDCVQSRGPRRLAGFGFHADRLATDRFSRGVHASCIFRSPAFETPMWWDEKREFHRVLVLAVLAGLSFGNHMQTVMLAPGFFFIIFVRNKKCLLSPKQLGLITLFFVLPLFIYLALPIRTWADAASIGVIQTALIGFFAHVTGRSHRSAYFLTRQYGTISSVLRKGRFHRRSVCSALHLCCLGMVEVERPEVENIFCNCCLFRSFLHGVFEHHIPRNHPL